MLLTFWPAVFHSVFYLDSSLLYWYGNVVILTKIFITGCTGSYHFGNFWSNLWYKFQQNDNIPVSVFVTWIISANYMNNCWGIINFCFMEWIHNYNPQKNVGYNYICCQHQHMSDPALFNYWMFTSTSSVVRHGLISTSNRKKQDIHGLMQERCNSIANCTGVTSFLH